ncbi:MAG: hypothetical protein K9N23_00120 [Akkermansiaceae bacterium]|nr:hypothetical protein [Akkermansiaceae bacterium]MCF7730054.1 hypothetical protein [Akkermansiaceae bacterium]
MIPRITRSRRNSFARLSFALVFALPAAGAAPPAFGAADAAAFSDPAREVHPETWFHFIGGQLDGGAM